MAAESLRDVSVAVTGATGFVGSRLVATLKGLGASVHAYGRRAGRLQPTEFRCWDIARGPLAGAPRVGAVVHCAGLVTDWGPRAEFWDCHVAGTRNVLSSFPEPCAVVHVSTASVYDPFGDKQLLREDAPPARRFLNAYSDTKARAEQLARARSRHVILRPHAIYGPGDRLLLPQLLAARLAGRQLAVGRGTNLISLTHVDNLIDAAVLGLRALLRGESGGTFNVADETPVAIGSVLRAVLLAGGRDPKVLYLPAGPAYVLGGLLEGVYALLDAKRGPALTRYRVVQIAAECTLDLARAKALLGYRPVRSVLSFIEEGGLAATDAGEARSTSSSE